MIPVAYHNGELAGIMSVVVTGFGDNVHEVTFQYLLIEHKDVLLNQYAAVTFQLGWWADKHLMNFMPCLVAPEGWSLRQLRRLNRFR